MADTQCVAIEIVRKFPGCTGYAKTGAALYYGRQDVLLVLVACCSCYLCVFVSASILIKTLSLTFNVT